MKFGGSCDVLVLANPATKSRTKNHRPAIFDPHLIRKQPEGLRIKSGDFNPTRTRTQSNCWRVTPGMTQAGSEVIMSQG